MKNTMEINHYRLPDSQGLKEAWDSCQFTSETDLSDFNVKSLVTINGQPILRQHHSAYLTGKDTSRAHHFAKYLAIQLLTTPRPVSSGTATAAPSTPPVPWAAALPPSPHPPPIPAAVAPPPWPPSPPVPWAAALPPLTQPSSPSTPAPAPGILTIR